MQLRFNRYVFAIALVVLCAIDWAVVAIALNGVDIVYAMAAMAVLMVLALVPLFLMVRPPVIASMEGDTLRVRRARVHLGDILRVSVSAKTLDLAARARDADGHYAGWMGERTLSLPLIHVDGGRKAAGAFAAFVDLSRQDAAPLEVAAPKPPQRPRRDGIDPDIGLPLDDRPTGEAAPAARPAFGRKGL